MSGHVATAMIGCQQSTCMYYMHVNGLGFILENTFAGLPHFNAPDALELPFTDIKAPCAQAHGIVHSAVINKIFGDQYVGT